MPALAKPELWRTEVGDAVAVLHIPGALKRSRTFDIDVSLLVRVPQDHVEAWHELTLEIDGKQQWQRRIPSSCPGQTDGLDYHCRVILEAGPARPCVCVLWRRAGAQWCTVCKLKPEKKRRISQSLAIQAAAC
jgi:hypothetical protein